MAQTEGAVAISGSCNVSAETPVRLGIVLEGIDRQLPIYCSPFRRIRIEGRAIPERMVRLPEEVGLDRAEIQWVWLQPAKTLGASSRARHREADNQWSIDLLDFPGTPPPGIARSWGTVSFAAAVRMRDQAPRLFLQTPGYAGGRLDLQREEGPAFRVTRSGAAGLSGAAMGFARLPIFPQVPASYVQQRVALAPRDLVLAAVEQLAGTPLPKIDAAPESSTWSWLFRPVQSNVRRRSVAGAPLVDAAAKPIKFSRAAADSSGDAKIHDILVADGSYAILDEDDGDGWLSEGDRVVHTVHGSIEVGQVADLPGKSVNLLRLRTFLQVRDLLKRAGYIRNPTPSVYPTADIFRGCREFQTDRGLPATGVPDEATLQALNTFVQRISAPDSAATRP